MHMSLSQFANAINSIGDKVTILGRGEPGIGKSSVLKSLAALRPDFDIAYIDCTLLDLGDIALPYIDTTDGGKTTRFAPNARFQLHTGRPAIVMLDELTKANHSVKNALLTLLQERRIGDSYLHPGSIVFATGNLDNDGVGDSLQAHARNRMCIIDIAKPDHTEWAGWAMGNDINPLVVAFVMQYPQTLASYTDAGAGNDNPYIYNPKMHQAGAFVTPRSLEQASHILDQRASIGHEATIAMLAGVIGAAAALDMSAFIDIADTLPSWFSITSTPHSAVVPDSPMARAILVYSAVSKITAANLASWMIYCQRLDLEFQAIFASQVLRGPAKQTATNSRDFIAWCAANSWAVC